eukprot:gene9417-10403_t
MAAKMNDRSMYTCPRYVELEYDVPLPGCMYKMKNIQGDISFHNGPDMEAIKAKKEVFEDGNDDEIRNLIQRQERILCDLGCLENEIKRLADKAGISENMQQSLEKQHSHCTSKDEQSKQPRKANVESGLPQDLDIVITAKPSDPPVSAFVMLHLLKQRGIEISSAVHKHSSLKQQVPSYLLQCVGANMDAIIQSHRGLTMTFIWKEEIFGPSLLICPRLQTAIRGDANIARYLCRAFSPDLFESLNEDVVCLIDHWISVATLQIRNGAFEQKALMQSMNKALACNKFLACDDLTLADIVVWSAITMTKNLAKSLTGNAKEWYLNCNMQFSQFCAKNILPTFTIHLELPTIEHELFVIMKHIRDF